MNDDEVQRATDILLTGGVVAHACEGVWGLACDAYSFASVQRILELKRRPIQNGLILIGDQAAEFSVELMGLNEEQREEVVNSWPGPETWILETHRFPAWITGGRGTVAVRVPGHEQAREMARRFGGPLVSTSANRSGEEPGTCQTEVAKSLGDEVDYLLPGATSGSMGPSRIRVAGSGEVLR